MLANSDIDQLADGQKAVKSPEMLQCNERPLSAISGPKLCYVV